MAEPSLELCCVLVCVVCQGPWPWGCMGSGGKQAPHCLLDGLSRAKDIAWGFGSGLTEVGDACRWQSDCASGNFLGIETLSFLEQVSRDWWEAGDHREVPFPLALCPPVLPPESLDGLSCILPKGCCPQCCFAGAAWEILWCRDKHPFQPL